jgi:hypothetical protein
MADIPEHVSEDLVADDSLHRRGDNLFAGLDLSTTVPTSFLAQSHANEPGGRVRSSVVVHRIHASHQEGPA